MADEIFDPRFPLPPIKGAKYGDDDGADSVPDSDATIIVDSDIIDTSEHLLPPESIVIVEQIVRTSEDGKRIVDLVLEVDDVPGALQYEARLSKL